MARKQSSTIWFEGQKHKEIYFNGHYHDKMYLSDSSGKATLVWQKLQNQDQLLKSIQDYPTGIYLVYNGDLHSFSEAGTTFFTYKSRNSQPTYVDITDYFWDVYRVGGDRNIFLQEKNTLRNSDTFVFGGTDAKGIYFGNIASGRYHLYYATAEGKTDLGEIWYERNGQRVYPTYNISLRVSGDNGNVFLAVEVYDSYFGGYTWLSGYLGELKPISIGVGSYYHPIQNSSYMYYTYRPSEESERKATLYYFDTYVFDLEGLGDRGFRVLADTDDFTVISGTKVLDDGTSNLITRVHTRKGWKDIIFDVKPPGDYPLLSNFQYDFKKDCYYVLARGNTNNSISRLYRTKDGINYENIGYFAGNTNPNNIIRLEVGYGLIAPMKSGTTFGLIDYSKL